jgi:short-subunit dehydrogenase
MQAQPIAAVTGASRGIGRATVLELARRGYGVFALARSETDLRKLAEEAARTAGTVTPLAMDVAAEDSRRQAVQAIMEQTDGYGLDVLVNNAGYGQVGPLEELPVEKLRQQLDVNVIGLLAFTQPFLRGMRERGHGRIVNLSSAAGRVATPFMGAYNASKFALEGMSDALRLELAPWNVRVILIEPGPIPTHFGEVAEKEAAVPPGSAYGRFYRRYQSTHGSVGFFARTPEAVARLIVKAIESERPRARYTITLPARLADWVRLVPDGVRDWGYRLVMGLHRTG